MHGCNVFQYETVQEQELGGGVLEHPNLIELIEFAHFKKDYCVPVHLLYRPILFLRLCDPHAWASAMLHMATSTDHSRYVCLAASLSLTR